MQKMIPEQRFECGSRVIADTHRKFIASKNGMVPATILLDGFVAGVWKVEKSRNLATLVIEPFEKLSRQECEALTDEGERLVRFVGDDVKAHSIRFEVRR